MNALIQPAYETPTDINLPTAMYDDPLAEDRSSDLPIISTRRALTRLALVAAETGARFQRDGEGMDPMAWILAPRRLFDGEAALEAVLAHGPFMRALLLHGLSIGLDAEPAFIDDLVAGNSDDDIFDEEEDRSEQSHIASGSDTGRGDSPNSGGQGPWFAGPGEVEASRWAHLPGATLADGSPAHGPRLFTATLVHHDGRSTLHVFHASVCNDFMEAYQRLVARYGRDAASDAELNVGFDPTTTFAEALVSPAMSELLQLVDSAPDAPLAAGLDLNLEQRFAA